jgi:hypothetical protein
MKCSEGYRLLARAAGNGIEVLKGHGFSRVELDGNYFVKVID